MDIRTVQRTDFPILGADTVSKNDLLVEWDSSPSLFRLRRSFVDTFLKWDFIDFISSFSLYSSMVTTRNFRNFQGGRSITKQGSNSGTIGIIQTSFIARRYRISSLHNLTRTADTASILKCYHKMFTKFQICILGFLTKVLNPSTWIFVLISNVLFPLQPLSQKYRFA